MRLGTAAPDPSAVAGWVSGAVGATQGGAPSSTLEGMANIPILGGRGAIRAVAYRELRGGYIEDTALDLRRANRTVREGGRLSAVVDLNPAWRLNVGAVSQFITSDDTQYAQPGVGAYARAVQVREPHDNDFLEAHVGLRGRFEWGEANVSAALIRHQVVSRYDATAAPPMPTPPGPSAYDDDDDIATLVTEMTVASSGDPRSAWLAGAFFASTRQTVGLRLTSLAGAPVLVFDEARKDRLEEAALFGQASAPITSRLGITVGGRLFRTETRLASLTRAPLAGGAASFAGASSRTGFAPKLEATYAFSPQRLIYVQAAEGYRVGGRQHHRRARPGVQRPRRPAALSLLSGRRALEFRARRAFQLSGRAPHRPGRPVRGPLEEHPERSAPALRPPVHRQYRRRAQSRPGGGGELPERRPPDPWGGADQRPGA